MSVASRPVMTEFGLPANPMPRTILRTDESTRLPRAFRMADHDRPRAASEDTRPTNNTSIPRRLDTSTNDLQNSEDGSLTPQQGKAGGTLLSPEETTALFQEKVNEAREERRKRLDLGENEIENQSIDLALLTVDVGHANIARLPENVIDLIKDEVNRLSLSHNQIWHIPLRFSECSNLRYLNIRCNVFREIPRGVYKLTYLEILDVSRNKIQKISNEIRNLASLRVLSVIHNRIHDLPAELYEMSKLQVVKMAENPLRFKLKKVIEAKEAEMTHASQNETEAAVTAEIKKYLRETHPISTPIDIDSGGEASEGPLDTPKAPLKRVLSSRFPVIPSTNGTDGTTDLALKSPSSSRPPPIPTRSHYRMQSGQNPGLLRRPGIGPLVNGNERNRSNSESVLQASAAARSKRMGIMKKDRSELDTVEETRTNRHSHLRGFSHGSVLRSKNANLSSGNSSSPNSPKEPRRNRLAFVRRLSSLPEQKQQCDWKSPIVEGAKGVLYALYQIHPHISGLISVVKGTNTRRSSLELTFYNASSHVERLNEALDYADSLDDDDEDGIDQVEDNIQRDCATCIMAYTHVTTQLQDNVRKIVSGADARYVRTLMLLLYGSMIEMKNAVKSFEVEIQTIPEASGKQTAKKDVAMAVPLPPIPPAQAITPTRDHQTVTVRPSTRVRSDTTIQHPSALNPLSEHPFDPHTQPLPAIPAYAQVSPVSVSTVVGNAFSNTSSYTNRSTLSSRSGSNSRSTANLSSLNSSTANTPRSGESLPLPAINQAGTRINPVTGYTDLQEDDMFEAIYQTLVRALDAARPAIELAKKQFLRCADAAEENRSPKEIRDLWANLLYRCNVCREVSELLRNRLSSMSLPVKGVTANANRSGSRNDRGFWQLCKTFLQSWLEMFMEMKEAKSLRLLGPDIIIFLRPVQKASGEASRLINESPWAYLANNLNSMPLPLNTDVNGTNGFYPSGGSYISNGVNVGNPLHDSGIHSNPTSMQGGNFSALLTSTTTTQHASMASNISPVSVPLPPTPMSAALGAAAHATVPSTPASAYGDQFFAGNVFQRADSLLNMHQSGSMSSFSRRG